ncbi:MAG: hypothetical protein ABW082_06220 [Sedimenticola sp.]
MSNPDQEPISYSPEKEKIRKLDLLIFKLKIEDAENNREEIARLKVRRKILSLKHFFKHSISPFQYGATITLGLFAAFLISALRSA